MIGSNWTRGEETVVSGIYDRYSVSVGQFRYQTDGFRKNADLENNVGDFFLQAALTPELNVQAEVRARRTEYGDIFLKFDPDLSSDDFKVDVDQDIVRFGMRYSPSPTSSIIGSFIASHLTQKFQVGPPDTLFDFRNHDDGLQGESQYIWSAKNVNVVAGGGISSVDNAARDAALIIDPVFGQDVRAHSNSDTSQKNGYLYANVMPVSDVQITIGMSADDFDQENDHFTKVSPKIGGIWQITPNVSVRSALFRTIAPALVTKRTIQPTQVAGFNQFFEDFPGTDAWRYGVGLDAVLSENLRAGLEVSRRNLSQPSFVEPGAHEDRHGELYRVYAYWTPFSEWAMSAELMKDRFSSNSGETNLATPDHVQTWSVPVSATYFSPFGYFLGASLTYLFQDVEKPSGPGSAEGDDGSFLVNAAAGYRLPKRLGLISVEVANIFNERLKYQDDSFAQRFEDDPNATPTVSPFIPERAIVGRVTLNF